MVISSTFGDASGAPRRQLFTNRQGASRILRRSRRRDLDVVRFLEPIGGEVTLEQFSCRNGGDTGAHTCRYGRVLLAASGYLAEWMPALEVLRPSGQGCVAQTTVNELVE